MFRLHSTLPLLALGALIGGSCATSGTLVGEHGAHRQIARDDTSGITVVLTTGAWDGSPPDLSNRITVIHALVSNMGTSPIRLAPGDLEMQNASGFRYELLDAGARFAVAEQDGSRTVYSQDPQGNYDPGRSDAYGEIHAVGGDVHPSALPWGTLLPGTQMRGFLYFEPVEESSNQARLTWHFDTPQSQPVVDLAFDFHVARPR